MTGSMRHLICDNVFFFFFFWGGGGGGQFELAMCVGITGPRRHLTWTIAYHNSYSIILCESLNFLILSGSVMKHSKQYIANVIIGAW